MRSFSRRVISAGSYPMLRRTRSIHSSVVNSRRRRRYSSRSNVAIWIGVSRSIQNGFFPFPSSSYSNRMSTWAQMPPIRSRSYSLT